MPTLVLTLEDGAVLTVPIDVDLVTLGRDAGSAVALVCPSVSAHHAVLKRREEGWLVQDLGSSNGTRLNGVLIEEAFLSDGDSLGFGDVMGVFYLEDVPTDGDGEYAEEPDEPVAVIPRPPVRKKAPERPKPRRPAVPPPDEGGGCLSTLLIILLFVGSMLIGLGIRHNQETGGNLFSELFDRFTGGLPQIKIEKRVDE